MDYFILVSYYLSNSKDLKYIVFSSIDEYEYWKYCADDFGLDLDIYSTTNIYYEELLQCSNLF